jgi:nucleoside-diphosphate-sugar epimerase
MARVAPARFSNSFTFRTNTLSTYNVFEAARTLKIKNLVWASSETLLGLPFNVPPPYIPVDEEYPARQSLESPLKRFNAFIIANADTVMTRPNAELIAERFPGVPIKKEVEPNETLLSIDKARRVLGYEPQYSWRKS